MPGGDGKHSVLECHKLPQSPLETLCASLLPRIGAHQSSLGVGKAMPAPIIWTWHARTGFIRAVEFFIYNIIQVDEIRGCYLIWLQLFESLTKH
jgi:hypothetical protein